MGRLFEEHITRKVKSLDGLWKFKTDPEDLGTTQNWFEAIPEGESVIVPSVWNTQHKLLCYEGAVWYEKDFYTDGGCLRLCFGAVMTSAQVWFDGKYIGSHYGGFSAFDFIIPDVDRGTHRITVLADNRFDEHSIPQVHVDWYHYGGITRGVTVETLEGVCVLSNHIDYTLSDDLKSAGVRMKLKLINCNNSDATAPLKAKINGELIFNGEVKICRNETKEFVIPEINLDNINMWDIGKGNLYNISVETDTDDLCDRIGFRKIESVNNKIFLNGREIEIRGVNRHEEHPDFGFAFPSALMKKDIDLILDMGCNAIRGSHYPNSKEFVDFLDELGILFWSEIPIWGEGFSVEAIADKTVVERGQVMLEEMLCQYYNHPCIIMWGMHNEIKTESQPAYDMSKKYYEYLKQNGGNRLCVYASNRLMDDICFEFTDVICLNQYLGWYGDNIYAWEKFVDDFIEKRNNLGFEKKPIIFSEFGGAALYGCHDDEDIMWSEEYQAKLISHCLEIFHKHPCVVGSFIWQFSDMRTCKEAGINRARGFNNKGIVNEYRKPKLSYYAAGKIYKKSRDEEN